MDNNPIGKEFRIIHNGEESNVWYSICPVCNYKFIFDNGFYVRLSEHLLMHIGIGELVKSDDVIDRTGEKEEFNEQ